MMDSVLERAGVKYEDLNEAERQTLNQMLESVRKNKVTVETIREYVDSMIAAVAEELADQSMKRPSFFSFMFNYRRDYLLKARLKNYMLLHAMLDTPKKAQKAIEQALAGMGAKANADL